MTVLPIQNFYAQNHAPQSECCDTETDMSNHDCCDTETETKHGKHQDNCKDCCATAHQCPACFVYVSKLLDPESSQIVDSSKQSSKFLYKTPFVYSLFTSIWQPPKIA